jgi:hypothetical protein
MKVEAELKIMYKITVGNDGMCMGQYYPEDNWSESYYNENLKELAEEMSVEYFSGLPTRKFDFEQVQVLLYDDRKYPYETLGEYNPYCKDDDTLKKEYAEFMCYWTELESERKKMIEVQKLKEERAKKIEQIKYEEDKKAKELAEYLKLKEKFEKEGIK